MKPTTHKARIAVVGTGWWATYAHLPALLARADDVELVALADLAEEKLAKAADAFDVAKTYTDYRNLLASEELDGVVIATSHAVHYEIARAALEKDCHVLVEKPLVLRSDQARELTDLAVRRGKAIVVSFPWNYTPHVRRARQCVEAGELGEVQMLSSLYTSWAYETYRGDPKTLDKVFSTVAEAPVTRPRNDANTDPELGGGQGYCQVSHSAALAFLIAGLAPRRVSAFMDKLNVAVDVVDALSFQLSNGAPGVLSSTGNVPLGDPGQHTLWVYGSEGYLILDLIAGTLRITKKDGTIESPDPLSEDQRYPRFAPAENLVDVILGQAENLAPGELGRLTVDFLAAVYKSASAGGSPIEVNA